MSTAKQHHDSANTRSKHPKGAGKRSYQKALRQAEKNGSALYRGKSLTLQQLGGTPAVLPPARTSKPQRAKPQKDEVRYLSWNAGALTTAVWEELLSLLETEPFSEVKLVVVQETHWRGSWQFSKSGWHVVSSGTHKEQGAGVLIMVHGSLCKAKDIRFNEIMPGRLLHVRIPGESFSLDIISFYQFVWRSKQTLTQNQEQRKDALAKLSQTIAQLPQRNTLLVAGDFNTSLNPDKKHVGPCTIGLSRLGQRGTKDLQRLLERHKLIAANTWSVRKPATHVQGNSVSQIDFALLRQSQARGPGKSCSPCRKFPVAIWREGSRHYPLLGGLVHSRRYSAQPVKNYDQVAMEFCYRMDPDSLDSYTRMVDDALQGTEPSWALLRQTMEQALQSTFPKKRNEHRHHAESLWSYRRTLRSLPEVLLALADLHRQLKQRLVWRTWAAVARQSAAARHAQRRKFEQRQQLIDEQLAQAEAKSSRDGSHSLYKVIRSFKTGKPHERVQLRDEHGRFLTMKEERKVLEDYSRDLFGTGLDFQLTGASGSLGITTTEVMDQLRSIKVGKAVPRDCPPIVAWRSLGPEAIQHISQLLNKETQADSLDPKITSSSISWLPKPPKKPDKPASLRPIGVIAPEGKVLAGHLRKRLKPTLQAVMSEVTQFGFVPGRGTEEAICKALTHVDEARERARHMQRQAGRGHGGVTLKGSLTFSVDMSKAFDMVDRRRLRESLELADADPFLIDLVGKLHIQALYDMTASDQAFSIATQRGIKQGCKLAPSLFAFATFLLFRRLGAKSDIASLQKVLTMYADDTLLQMHFDDKAQMQEALQLCDLLLDQLTELGFKVNPEKSALLLQLHGGSAQPTRQGLITTEQGEKFVQLPSGRLIALRSQVTYLGIIISYQDYEMKSLRHRLQASKAALKEVAHAVRNSRAVTEKRRLSIWRITAWASAMYGLHVVGLTPQGLSQLESHMIFQLRFVLRSYSQETHETNQQFLQRNGFKTAKLQVLKRLQQFIKRQSKPGGNKSALLPFFLPRAETLFDSMSSLTASSKVHTINQQQQHVCTECGSLFSGTGALRRHSQKHHAGACLYPKGPRFNPKRHAKAGTPECIACGHQFRSYFFLRRHVEASTCPRVSILLQNQDDAEEPITELEQLHERIKVEALRDPGQTAMNPDLQLWLLESCALCGQALAGNKAVKQHLNRQHPDVMTCVQAKITPKLQQHKVMMKKGQSCRYCRTKVDAPGRHSEQCVPLLQTHVLQEAQRQRLDLTPRAYEGKSRAPSTTSRPRRAPQIGLQVPVFVLEGFLLLANRHNHCYANSALQILHWVMPAMSSPVLQEAFRASQLARITPEHHVLAAITRGWTFDGSQHDSAEFLSAILPNLPGFQVCSWETRSPMEAGYVVDDEGLSPIFLAAPLAADLQAMINQWSNQTPVHAMITAERYAVLALPRYVGAGKNSSPIRLQETLSLPVFEAEGSDLSWHSFGLRAGVTHIGEETTSGHYRSFIRTATQWFLADDSRPPTACNLNDPTITSNVYLLLLELQQD